MPATVVAEHINWPYGMTTLNGRLREIHSDYVGVDPADRINHVQGDSVQCDLWFPEVDIPIPGRRSASGMPVLVIVARSPASSALSYCPWRWRWISWRACGCSSSSSGWSRVACGGDRQSGISTTRGRPTDLVNAFIGTLGCGMVIAPPADPEFKGSVEQHNKYLETSFLPGRTFTGPADFQIQLDDWLSAVADQLTIRGQVGTPIDVFNADEHPRILTLPPVAPKK